MRLRIALVAVCLLLQLPLAAAGTRPAPQRVERGKRTWQSEDRRRASWTAATRARLASRERRLSLERGLERIDFQSVLHSPTVTDDEASRLVTRARRKLGVDFRLEWENPSQAIFHVKGKPIVVPRGLVQAAGMTADGLALILAHEAAHAKGHGREGPADYWAVRRGLRELWGKTAFSGSAPRRPLLAAFSALRSQFTEDFEVRAPGRPEIVVQATGYPTLQSRWEIFKAGIVGRNMPRVTRREPEGEPELLTLPEAATYLGVSTRWLKRQAGAPGGPIQINMNGGPQFDKDNLDQFRARTPLAAAARQP
jgi:hypothetical protein